LALHVLLQTVDALKGLGATNFRVLITMVPPRPSRDGAEARAMLQGDGLPVFESEVPRLVAYQKAALAGVPVLNSGDPRATTAWESYLNVGREILP